MIMDLITDPAVRLRGDPSRLRDLYAANLLTPERLEAVLKDCESCLEWLAAANADDEHFEITLEGLQALHKGGKPLRWAGHLQVVDGGQG